MNERIRELAEQAGVTGYFAAGTEYATPIPLSNDIEKFAELIVKECFEHCKGQLVDKKTAEHMGLTYNDAVGDCANGLLQHFGVEE
jgi:hypothetical protein